MNNLLFIDSIWAMLSNRLTPIFVEVESRIDGISFIWIHRDVAAYELELTMLVDDDTVNGILLDFSLTFLNYILIYN